MSNTSSTHNPKTCPVCGPPLATAAYQRGVAKAKSMRVAKAVR